MIVKIIQENIEQGSLNSVLELPANEALELISRRQAVWAPEEEYLAYKLKQKYLAYKLKQKAQAKGDEVAVKALEAGEKMTEAEKQEALKNAEECDSTDCEGCEEEACAKKQEEYQQENPYAALPNKDSVKAELDKRAIPYDKNAKRPDLEALLLNDDKEKSAAGNADEQAETE